MKSLIIILVSFILFVEDGHADAVCQAFTKMSCSSSHKFNLFLGKPGPPGPPGRDATGVECPARLTTLQNRLKVATKYVEDTIAKMKNPKCKIPKHTYRRYPRKLTYMEARQFCKGQGGDLPQYGARTSFDRGHIITSLGGSLSEKFWFGLNDGMQEGAWKWIDGSSVDAGTVGFNSQMGGLEKTVPAMTGELV